MQVRVLFFGQLKDLVGKGCDSITLPEGARLSGLLDHYQEQFPLLSKFLPATALSLNQEYAAPGSLLHEGDEVALLPPVSGGAGTSIKVGNTVETRQHAPKKKVALVREKIESQAFADAIKRAEDGAVACFEGVVRDHSRGRRTLYLDYEAYEAMALRQMQSLVEEALGKFKIRDATVVHRLGRLEIGETSVLIAVAAAHRAAAFDACRWLIDTLKRTVPIWKKEYFEDGAVWAQGEPFPERVPAAGPAPDGSGRLRR